jgi:hypothetical protein
MWEPFPPAPLPPVPPRPRRRLRPWTYSALGLVAFVLAVVYVLHRLSIITPRAQRLSTLQAMPEASLLVPGSHVLYEHGSPPASLGLGTSSEAFSYKVVGTNETQAAILTFYTANFAQRGWNGPQPAPTAFAATVTKRWERGHYVLTIDILGSQSGTYPGEAQYATAYVLGIRYTSTALTSPTPTS